MNWLRTILQRHRERQAEWRPDFDRALMRRKINGEWQYRPMTSEEFERERIEEDRANAW